MALRLAIMRLVLDRINHLSLRSKRLERSLKFVDTLENALSTFFLKSRNGIDIHFLDPTLSVMQIAKLEPKNLSIPSVVRLISECEELNSRLEVIIFKPSCNVKNMVDISILLTCHILNLN